MTIGSYNVFEAGCRCEAIKVGNNNIVEAKAKVGRNTELSTGCIIGASCDVRSQETLPDNTVIFGALCNRRLQAERPPPQTLQLDFLMKILPNYHHLKKATKHRQIEK
ncbi:dynactin subunit 6-like [Saccoglossus kowalevskii]